MVLGTGLADFRGGVLKYACDLGLDRVLDQLRRTERTVRPAVRAVPTPRAAAADPVPELVKSFHRMDGRLVRSTAAVREAIERH